MWEDMRKNLDYPQKELGKMQEQNKKMSGQQLDRHLTNFLKKILTPKIKKEYNENVDLFVYDIGVEEYGETIYYYILIDSEQKKVSYETIDYIKLEVHEFLYYLGLGIGQYNLMINRRFLSKPLDVNFIKSTIKENYDELPFQEETQENFRLRTFDENLLEEDLKWHWDEQDRIVIPTHNTDWMLQMDNELPVNLQEGKEYFIPKGIYHRVIKGNGNLKVKIIFK